MSEAAITDTLNNDDLEKVIAAFLHSESEIITNDKIECRYSLCSNLLDTEETSNMRGPFSFTQKRLHNIEPQTSASLTFVHYTKS